MEIPANLIFVLGILSSLIVWILKEAFVKQDKPVPEWVYTVGLFVAAFVLSVAFVPVPFPPFPPFVDLPTFLGAVIAWLGAALPVLSAAVGFATIVYQALLKKVLDGLANATKKFLSKKKLV